MNKLVLNVCREKTEAKAVLMALRPQASPLLISEAFCYDLSQA